MGAKVQFPAKLIPLLSLGLFQTEIWRVIIGRRIGHCRVKPEFEKIVPKIVMLADVVAALAVAVGAERMAKPVDESQEIKGSRRTDITGSNAGKIIAVENKPGNCLGQILGFPFPRKIPLRNSDRPEENTTTIKVLIMHGQLGMELLSKAAKETARASRHREPQLPAPGAGKGIKNKLAVEFISEGHVCY